MPFGQLVFRWVQQLLLYMLKVEYLKYSLNKPYNQLKNLHKKFIILYGLVDGYHIGSQLIYYMLN